MGGKRIETAGVRVKDEVSRGEQGWGEKRDGEGSEEGGGTRRRVVGN